MCHRAHTNRDKLGSSIKPESGAAQTPNRLLTQLARALKTTTADLPRPLVDLGLPANARHLMAQEKVDNFRSAAVLVPIILRADTPYVVLTVRSANLRKHAGQISFPGGSSEPQDQSLVATALRESHEEIGLQPANVKILGYLDDYPTVTGFRVTPVVGLLDAEATMQPDGVEVSEIFEVPLTHLAEDKNYQRDTLMREGLEVPYYAIAHKHYKIWGATAGMLRDLQNKMKQAL